jgi:hypothetical protein
VAKLTQEKPKGDTSDELQNLIILRGCTEMQRSQDNLNYKYKATFIQ